MASSKLQVLILAAGKGTRMASNIPKVLHDLSGAPMIHYVLDTVQKIPHERINIVVGHEKEKVMEAIRDWQEKNAHPMTHIRFIVQEEQLGTGHAVLCSKGHLKKDHDLLVLLGDVPFIRVESLTKGALALSSGNDPAVVLTTELDDPHGYGRIIRDENGCVEAIREQNEASPVEASIKEINTGIFFFRGKYLWEHIHKLTSDNSKGELYLTDMVSIFRENGQNTLALKIKDSEQFFGINSLKQLSEMEKKQKEAADCPTL